MPRIHRIPRSAVVIAAALLSFGFWSSSASPAVPADSGQTHCATEVRAGQPLGTSETCFATFDKAIAYATAGRVQLANATDARQVAVGELAAGSAAALGPLTSSVLSIAYKGTGYTGSTYTFFASGPCGSWQVAAMPAGWNDAIQSISNFSGCAATLYQNGPFVAPVFHTGVNASLSTLGTFNNKTSSIKWCPTFGCS
jgi:Peptidase inhibitor family I36